MHVLCVSVSSLQLKGVAVSYLVLHQFRKLADRTNVEGAKIVTKRKVDKRRVDADKYTVAFDAVDSVGTASQSEIRECCLDRTSHMPMHTYSRTSTYIETRTEDRSHTIADCTLEKRKARAHACRPAKTPAQHLNLFELAIIRQTHEGNRVWNDGILLSVQPPEKRCVSVRANTTCDSD